MKKSLIFFSFFICCLCFFYLNISKAQEESKETIDNFEVSIKINSDSSLEVQENIVYNFSNFSNKEIIRHIPYTKIRDIKVLNNKEEILKYKKIKNKNNIDIKIFNKDNEFTGKQKIIINYKVKNAVSFLDDRDKLYWTVISKDWPLEIKQSKVTVFLPQSIKDSKLDVKCFTGDSDNFNKCISSRFNYKEKDLVNNVVFIDDVLTQDKELAFQIEMPKGFIKKLNIFEIFTSFIIDNWMYIVLIVLFIIIFLLFPRRRESRAGSD